VTKVVVFVHVGCVQIEQIYVGVVPEDWQGLHFGARPKISSVEDAFARAQFEEKHEGSRATGKANRKMTNLHKGKSNGPHWLASKAVTWSCIYTYVKMLGPTG